VEAHFIAAALRNGFVLESIGGSACYRIPRLRSVRILLIPWGAHNAAYSLMPLTLLSQSFYRGRNRRNDWFSSCPR
jgi:hypothetical protein